MNFVFWSWVPFGSHFGGVLGVQVEAKSSKKWSPKGYQKQVQKMIEFWSILGSHWGPFWSQKGGNKGSQKRPLFKWGSWGANLAPTWIILGIPRPAKISQNRDKGSRPPSFVPRWPPRALRPSSRPRFFKFSVYF